MTFKGWMKKKKEEEIALERQLRAYVHDMFSKGHKKKKIVVALKKMGYAERDIKKAIRRFRPFDVENVWALVAILLLAGVVFYLVLFNQEGPPELLNLPNDQEFVDQLIFESLNGDAAECDNIRKRVSENSSQQAYDDCVTAHALTKNLVGLCEFTNSSSCWHSYAVFVEDDSYCNGSVRCITEAKDLHAININESQACNSFSCIHTLAVLNNDSSLCGSDTLCANITSGSVGNCKDFSEVKARGACFLAYALLEEDSRYCNNVYDSHGCAIDMADIHNDLSICQDEFNAAYGSCQDRLTSFNATRMLEREVFGPLTTEKRILQLFYDTSGLVKY